MTTGPRKKTEMHPIMAERYERYTHGTGQIDHDLDHLRPNLPLRHAVQDMYSTDPTPETRAGSCGLYGPHPAAEARSYSLGIFLPCLADLYHEVGIGELSDVWKGKKL